MRTRLTCVLAVLCLAVLCSVGAAPASAASGTTLLRFAQVDEGVYRGSPPKTDADFRVLKSHGVKYIVALHFLPFLDEKEKKEARKHGMAYVPIFIHGSMVEPSEKNVNSALAFIRRHRNRGVYFHCILGRDRTSMVAALYKMYFLGESQESAWRNDMLAFGFKDSWTLRGLKEYFYKHPRPSPALLRATRS